ncbi:hypothetical protein DSLASN_45840 [Desulfoluna limicola]|uniref:Uncharacterized protein n=1 Tax=Desulfoluna limicola TaxID=2810562 RepID=A0ABM7PN53_9BACT|nr:hypothetical protein [Desulfoluna limicola]BCS98952.1 hypothetical protein DSLASN_45840 [Desulfoluna limicola]
MDIQIGVGIGPIRFGQEEVSVTNHLGLPESREYIEFEDALGDGTKVLGYYGDGLVFNFDSDDDFRLSTIAIREPGHTLYGKDLFGLGKLRVLTHLAQHIDEAPEEEIHSDEDTPDYLLVEYVDQSLFLWFDSDKLVEIEIGYTFHNDEPVWPVVD